jgi:hypothetical protein
MSGKSTPAQWPPVRRVSEWLTRSRAPHSEGPAAGQGDAEEALPRAMPDDLRWLTGREPGSTELLCHMLQALKIDTAAIPAETMRLLERHCARCNAKFQCADELGLGRAETTMHGFCPNLERLRTLRVQHAG